MAIIRSTIQRGGVSRTHDGIPITAFEINMLATWNVCVMRCQCGHKGSIESRAAMTAVDEHQVLTCCDGCGGVGFAFFGREK